MHRLLLVVTCAVAVLGTDDEDVMKNCGPAVGWRRCCKDDIKLPQETLDVLRECSQLPGLPSCEQDMCVATKFGFGTADGKIDAAKALKHSEIELADSPKIMASMKHCFSDYEKTGPPDMCHASKLRICFEKEYFKECSSWSEEGTCRDAKDQMENCLNALKKFNF